MYHDSCYLGRHNDVYLSPRNVVGSIGGIQVVEAERNGTKGMCCGAGGARMWMEEHVGKQINVERSQELLATGATRIATACPFCYVMIDDGVKGEGVEESDLLVADIAMHLLDAIEEGEAKTRPTSRSLVHFSPRPRRSLLTESRNHSATACTATLMATVSKTPMRHPDLSLRWQAISLTTKKSDLSPVTLQP